MAISGARGSDEGYYTCVGNSQFKKEAVFTSNLKIASRVYSTDIRPLSERLIFPPPDKDRFILVKNGEKLTIECRLPQSLPKAKLRLSRKSTDGVHYLKTEKTNYGIKIFWRKAADEAVSGEYNCEAENEAGKRNYSFFVYVISKPQFKKSTPISQRVKEGENVTFRCILLKGLNPTTKLAWMKDDVEINTLDTRFKVNSGRGELFIRDVQEYDAGSYSCKATTKSKFFQAVQSDNANLKVIIKLKFIPSFKDIYYLERSSYSSIDCKVKGSAIPTVIWRKSDNSKLPLHVYQKGDKLIFNKTEQSHSGNYTCISRLKNEKIEKTINITIVMKPKFSILPINTTVKIGSPVMLHCVAVGDPPPKVHWVHEFNKDLMKNSRFELKGNGTLSISTTYMQDAGKYTCWAGNTGGLSHAIVYLHVSSEDENSRASKFSMMKTIIIAVCSAVAYLAVVIGLTVYCSLRLVKRRNASKLPEDKQDGAECTELIEKPNNVHSIQTVGSIIKSDLNDSRSHASSHQSQSTATTSGYSKLLLRHNLQTIGLLGKSTFGEVLLAKSRTQDYSDTLVVVKSLLSSDEYHGQMFRSEIELFSRVSHDNVSKILAVSKDTEPHFFIMQYLEWGMLSAYLVALRRDSTSTTSPLTYGQQLAMCHQVSLGLEHIASLRMVHGDVAARNILLSPSLRLKVSTIALSRDAHAQDYYIIREKPVPIRWMAPEGLTPAELSTKSDVFSFGVFVWEVFTLGLIPHTHLANEEVLQALEAGTLILDPLQHCPLSTVIERCTMHQPVLRPSFSEISSILADMTKDCH
ncbi:DgyrCDS4282 [Dimorphilus gyrociliatus]|uniref:DgyrCDS4282 n=1 Tax=Dimorphilus gyrociliatus TaxID=2664684 RepID=A0A7I8VHY7_9ANNE|nr:DgyrCDS4282 [Dimorphilus gyrociliatus]